MVGAHPAGGPVLRRALPTRLPRRHVSFSGPQPTFKPASRSGPVVVIFRRTRCPRVFRDQGRVSRERNLPAELRRCVLAGDAFSPRSAFYAGRCMRSAGPGGIVGPASFHFRRFQGALIRFFPSGGRPQLALALPCTAWWVLLLALQFLPRGAGVSFFPRLLGFPRASAPRPRWAAIFAMNAAVQTMPPTTGKADAGGRSGRDRRAGIALGQPEPQDRKSILVGRGQSTSPIRDHDGTILGAGPTRPASSVSGLARNSIPERE